MRKPRVVTLISAAAGALTILGFVTGAFERIFTFVRDSAGDRELLLWPVLILIGIAIMLGVGILFTWLLGLLIGIVYLRARWSPKFGNPLALRQIAKLCLPSTYLIALHNLLVLLERLVEAGKLVDDHTTIGDRRFKERVLKPLFEQLKKTFDDINGADVAIQLKLFPEDCIYRLMCDHEPFDIFAQPLEPYFEVRSSGFTPKRPCRTSYRIIKDVEVEKLEAASRRLRESLGEDFLVSSGLISLFQDGCPVWMCNDLHSEMEKGNFFSDSPYLRDGNYRSVSMFLICRSFRGAGPDNIPIGVVWIESKKINRFDASLSLLLGMCFANLFYFFMKHSLKNRHPKLFADIGSEI